MPYARSESLISTDWLAAHLRQPEVRVVDGSMKLPGVRPTAHEDYAQRHIPGASFFDYDVISDHGSSLPHMLPRGAEIALHMERLGIGDEHLVVAYDSTGWSSAWRVWWMLRVFGHERAALLSGGLQKWLAEGRPVTREIPRPAPARFTPRFRRELVRDKTDWIPWSQPEIVTNCLRHRHLTLDGHPARLHGPGVLLTGITMANGAARGAHATGEALSAQARSRPACRRADPIPPTSRHRRRRRASRRDGWRRRGRKR